MYTRFNHKRLKRLVGMVTVSFVFIVGGNGTFFGFAPSFSAPNPQQATEVIIDVKTRTFQPDMISLQLGEKIRFVLRNKDAELHAFVPVGIFLDTTLNVSGNGAPQFGKEGLLRVLLPSTGQTEILFTPKKAGNYPFFCDLPGHVMRGTIVVQE